jgi:transposase
MTIIPDLSDQELQVIQVVVADEITFLLQATSPTASCPNCGTLSTRVHSRYQRMVHDLPNRGRPIRLMLFVRRFRCQKRTCGRKIFAEQFPTLTRPYVQHSLRLQETLRQIGLALGGQAGTRLGAETFASREAGIPFCVSSERRCFL